MHVDVLGAILIEDDQILTSALPTNSQLLLPDDVFVHFYGALEKGKAIIET